MSLAGILLVYPHSEVLVAAEVWIRQEEQAVKRLGSEDRELVGGCRSVARNQTSTLLPQRETDVDIVCWVFGMLL